MDIWMQVMHTGTESRNKYVSLTITVDKRHHLFFFSPPHTLSGILLASTTSPRGQKFPTVERRSASSLTPQALRSYSVSNKAEIPHPPLQHL